MTLYVVVSLGMCVLAIILLVIAVLRNRELIEEYKQRGTLEASRNKEVKRMRQTMKELDEVINVRI